MKKSPLVWYRATQRRPLATASNGQSARSFGLLGLWLAVGRRGRPRRNDKQGKDSHLSPLTTHHICILCCIVQHEATASRGNAMRSCGPQCQSLPRAWRLAPDVPAPPTSTTLSSVVFPLCVCEEAVGDGRRPWACLVTRCGSPWGDGWSQSQESQSEREVQGCAGLGVLGCFNDSFRIVEMSPQISSRTSIVDRPQAVVSGVPRWTANGRRAYLRSFEILKRKRGRVSLGGDVEVVSMQRHQVPPARSPRVM